MHIGLITYARGHLKTWQMTWNLLHTNHTVTLFAFPFRDRPTPSPDQNPDGTSKPAPFQDRPYQLMDYDPRQHCEMNGLPYVEVPSWRDEHAGYLDRTHPEVYMTCIAKIIPAAFIEGRAILNCHPGLLPFNRGVDAWKWGIVHGWPMGVSLHIIDPEIDRGTIIRTARVELQPGDTLHTAAEKTYELELKVMTEFEKYLNDQDQHCQVGDAFPVSHKRIDEDLEARLPELFERLKAS